MNGADTELDEFDERNDVLIWRARYADGCVALGCRAEDDLRHVEIEGLASRVLCPDHARRFVRREVSR